MGGGISILGGGRIPFQPSGTVYDKYSNYDLIKFAFDGIFNQVNIDKSQIDDVLVGNVIHIYIYI